MAGINLTNKEINILINGSLNQTFSQRANVADYNIDISVNDKQSWEWTTIHDGNCNLDVSISDGFYYLYCNYDREAELGGDWAYIKKADGTTICHSNSGSIPTERLIYLNAQTLNLGNNGGYDGSAKIERAANYGSFTDRLGNKHHIPTGASFNVNSISQS